MLQAGDPAPGFQAQPVFGQGVDVAAITAERPLVLCFVRPLSSPFARAALASLQLAFPRFDLAGAALVAVTPTALRHARDFVPRYHVLYPVITDPEGELAERFGVGRDRGGLGTVKAALRGRLGGVTEALQHGAGLPEGLDTQLPAEFVIAPGGRIALAHYGAHLAEQPRVEALVEAAASCTS